MSPSAVEILSPEFWSSDTMETRSLLRQMMGYSMPLVFLFLLAVATNDEEGGKTATPHPDKPSVSPSSHPSTAATELVHNAIASEENDTSKENENGKHFGEKHPEALVPPSEESNTPAKRPPKATISTLLSSPGKEPGAKPEQPKGEGEMRALSKSDDHGIWGFGASCQSTTPVGTSGSGGLTAGLGIIMPVVLSPLFCF